MSNEERLMFFLKKCEEKLKKYMSKEEYRKFAAEAAKEAFRIDLEGMEDSDFRQFCLDNFDEITK